MNARHITYDLDDILIEPAEISYIDSRSDISIYDENGFLPIFTAPMLDVSGIQSKEYYLKNKIYYIEPVKGFYELFTDFISFDKFHFKSINLEYAISLFTKENLKLKDYINNKPFYLLIDIANGHMQKLFMIIQLIKEEYPSIVLIVGNIANAATYKILAKLNVDYVRCSIGSGNSCLTSVNTGIGYPLASLLDEIGYIKREYNYNTKIIADGGIKSYGDAIKSLAIGGEYVMIGNLFNKSLESSGKTYLFNKIRINQYSKLAKWLFKYKFPLYKEYRGMSTKSVQRELKKLKIKTSEGNIKRRKVEYLLSSFIENFEDYLRSAMSYTGKRLLSEFIGKVRTNIISSNSYIRYKK